VIIFQRKDNWSIDVTIMDAFDRWAKIKEAKDEEARAEIEKQKLEREQRETTNLKRAVKEAVAEAAKEMDEESATRDTKE
jgi:hypothetical protein